MPADTPHHTPAGHSTDAREWVAICAALGAAANPAASTADIARAVQAALDEYDARVCPVFRHITGRAG